MGGGWDQASGVVLTVRDNPLPDGSGWRVHMFAESGDDLPATGTLGHLPQGLVDEAHEAGAPASASSSARPQEREHCQHPPIIVACRRQPQLPEDAVYDGLRAEKEAVQLPRFEAFCHQPKHFRRGVTGPRADRCACGP